jgi:uncharacterized OB-fold protein
MEGSKRPVPIPTNVTREFWERANEEVLVLPYCRDCGSYTFYPRSVCMKCMSRNLEWRPASGQGTVYSYTIVRSPQPAFRDMAPYVVANIELPEGVRMMANVLTDDPDSVHIGMPVKIVFVPVAPDLKLPQAAPTG